MDSHAIGIGLRQPHYRALLHEERGETSTSPDFVEVHSENFFADGGIALQVLESARSRYDLSLHGVGLSIGSADAEGDDASERHLAKLARLVARIEPELVSEHLCWGAIAGMHFNDLLPVPYTSEALTRIATRVTRVQDVLKRRILIENVSAYVAFSDSAMSETAFLAALAERTGCGILLDVNNLYVNAINCGFDARACLDELPPDAIGEIHLAGHLVTDECLIDNHGSRVTPAVWSLYSDACRRFGEKPTLIEWDTDVPELEVLLDEAARARQHRIDAMDAHA
ncbi:MAG: MNIO family bufferin maturase [Burkholderiaceae bacterium]